MIARETLNALTRFYEAQNLPDLALEPAFTDRKVKDEYGRPEILIHRGHDMSMIWSRSLGRVSMVSLDCRRTAESGDSPIPPISADSAMKLAEAFMAAIGIGEWTLGSPHVDLIPTKMPERVGKMARDRDLAWKEWKLFYPRTNARGIPFQGDNILVKVLQKYGPYQFVIVCRELNPQFSEGPLLDSSRVQDRALPYSQKLLAWPTFTAYFPNARVQEQIGEPCLRVVYPNMAQSRDLYAGDRGPATVAWVFCHKFTSELGERPVYVWIDALSGEWLGGEA